VVVYGIFLALGEFGPGDNIGLIASKTCATGIRYGALPDMTSSEETANITTEVNTTA
jgi:hypothetical protein